MKKLIGPFTQLLTMDHLPLRGPLSDDQLVLIPNGAILSANGKILKVGNFDSLQDEADEVDEVKGPSIALPGFVDAHTHICFAGSRAGDYAKRLQGKTYQQIAHGGGGILQTVMETRKTSLHELTKQLSERATSQLQQGVTTCEVKSGYGLTLADELKMLEAISLVNRENRIQLVPTCLAAHVTPPEFTNPTEYLEFLTEELLPQVVQQKLSERIDIFIEKGAFTVEEARPFLLRAKELGFSITIHANQFSSGGASLAIEVHAQSADHLEHLSDQEIEQFRSSQTAVIALPAASLGLGMPFCPARKMLDSGLCLAIASDWNPGSAPMGNLLCAASLLAIYEKLTTAETLAGLTCRAAHALAKKEIGVIRPGNEANITYFSGDDFREILYHQGVLQPTATLYCGHYTHKR